MNVQRVTFGFLLIVSVVGCEPKTSEEYQKAAFERALKPQLEYLEAHQSVVSRVEKHGGSVMVYPASDDPESFSLMIIFSDNAQVDDSVLKGLLGEGRVRLFLRGTKITDVGLAYLENNTKIEVLSLFGTDVSDSGVESIISLTGLQILVLSKTTITDHGVAMLAQLPNLEELSLSDNDISDEGIASLAGLTKLRVLRLNHTRATDSSLETLKTLRDLERLHLDGTKVTDEGVEHLVGLKRLKTVWVRGTDVTNAAADRLRRAIPGCKVHLGPE